MRAYIKDPDALLDYVFDWSDWLDEGELITGVAIVTQAGLTLESFSQNDGEITIWVSDGTVGVRYQVSCRIETDQGRTDDRSLWITIKER